MGITKIFLLAHCTEVNDANQTLDVNEVRMPRLLSVNVGLPRDVTSNGKTVRTSVWKTPVTGRVEQASRRRR
jgi:hypothetical protein